MNDRQRRSKLVLHLSKPWEMGEALGWQPLSAQIDRQQGDGWIVELEKPIRYHESEIRYLKVAPRLEGWDLTEAGNTEVPCKMTPIERLRETAPRGPEPADCDADADNGIFGSVTDYH